MFPRASLVAPRGSMLTRATRHHAPSLTIVPCHIPSIAPCPSTGAPCSLTCHASLHEVPRSLDRSLCLHRVLCFLVRHAPLRDVPGSLGRSLSLYYFLGRSSCLHGAPSSLVHRAPCTMHHLHAVPCPLDHPLSLRGAPSPLMHHAPCPMHNPRAVPRVPSIAPCPFAGAPCSPG